MEDGDLTNIIKWDYDEDFCKWIIYCVAEGLQALHSRNVLHRDIKAENILFRGANGDIKVADLGLSVILSNEVCRRSTMKGSTAFTSPEVILGSQYGKEVDIWAFGCTAFELAMGKLPF